MTEHSPGRREQRKAALRQAVRDAGWQLVVDRGYESVTVDDIASAAGTSTATFYRHFSGKEEVLTRRWLSPERLAELAPHIDKTQGLAVAVASLFRAYATMAAGYQVDVVTRLKVINLDMGLEIAMARGRQEDIETLAELFGEISGQPPGSLAMRLAASLTASARITAMSRWAELDGQLPLDTLLDEVAKTLAATLDNCETARRRFMDTVEAPVAPDIGELVVQAGCGAMRR
ncbi:TetR/AcrR family transcriptional regulator [Nocardioides massiliensis]|uniref:AcrR family transcriptional regulator n=1 Tax=Nocardioides massiliensis TaxID=1325935 RepID=A0ABT9NKR5_9ACTN|nr:TetR/AcrR family transcriptional regulator [Nocardioides massiliensis]MDP9820814.1 AcrR family transcriptional regulator [Nocardioides massiliensis]